MATTQYGQECQTYDVLSNLMRFYGQRDSSVRKLSCFSTWHHSQLPPTINLFLAKLLRANPPGRPEHKGLQENKHEQLPRSRTMVEESCHDEK